MSEVTKFDIPNTLHDPKVTYLGHNQRIISEIDTNGSTNLGGTTLSRHINTPGAVVPDPRYINNRQLDEARTNALEHTIEVAKAEGGKLVDDVKQNYAAAMGHLRNTHYSITTDKLLAEQQIRKDVEKIAELAANKLGKKVAVVAGFLLSSASFAGEAIDASGKIVRGENPDTEKLKAAAETIAYRGVEGAVGIVDPLGVIDTKKMTEQLLNGNPRGAAQAFNNERLNAAASLAEIAQEYTR